MNWSILTGLVDTHFPHNLETAGSKPLQSYNRNRTDLYTQISLQCCGAGVNRSQDILAGAGVKVRLQLQLNEKEKNLNTLLFFRSNIDLRQIKNKSFKINEFFK